jgi:hypothetical protein
MASVKLQGNASGTGSLTVQAPNTNSNLTLGLPASNGTLVTTGDTGTVATAMLADSAVSSVKLLSTDWTRSISTNGYQKLPGGLIIQWGSNSSSSASVTFPIAFPTALLQVIYSFGYPSSQAAAGGYQWLTAQSTTGFTTYYDPAGASGKGTWIAVGY